MEVVSRWPANWDAAAPSPFHCQPLCPPHRQKRQPSLKMHSPGILIVEDDTSMLRGLKDNFEAQNFRVEIARDGREALALALAHSPDLILLDIMLPKMNGYEVCRAVRERKLDMPIIMLTAKGQEEDIIRGLELGADDYVTKPFSIRQLLARARAFLRRHSNSESIFAFGNFKL